MDFNLLGPLSATHDGESVDLGPRKQRALLALLLLSANRVVSTDRILESLWGEDSLGKENALWVYVSRLRSILEPDSEKGHHEILRTQDHGYLIATDVEAIDSHRFEQLAWQGSRLMRDDPSAAAPILAEALSLWRGDALADFTHEDFAQAEIHRLGELRLQAIEDHAEARLRLGHAGELVGELESTHAEHPHRERSLTQLMLALYRSGRQADALRSFERYRRGLAEDLGLEPSPELRRLEEQILLHDPRLQRRQREAGASQTGRREAPNPFKGLRAFNEADDSDFFGRDRLVAETIRRIADGERLVTLVGASGSGKSSAVRAGLIPALRKGAIDESENWLIAQMVPGAHPFAELEAALLRSTIDAPDSLSDQLSDGDDGLLRAVLRVLPDNHSRLLLVVDQFEELFTLVESEGRRARFLSNFAAALDDPHGRVVIVLTLRADFYDQPLRYPDFASRLATGVVNVSPLAPDELEAAAHEPAARSGVSLEPALLATLIADVIGQPGGLPLFQYALTELFDRRTQDTLTLKSYEDMGGVRGALGKRANDLYSSLDVEHQDIAMQIFLRLVAVGEGNQSVRRRVHASELVSLEADVVATQTVVDLFGQHRLLSFDLDAVSGEATLEVAHEALLTEWDRLARWIGAARDDIRRRATLANAIEEWHGSGLNVDYLLSGSRLDDYRAWADIATLRLTSAERGFIDKSAARHDEMVAAEDQRQERELALTRRSGGRTARVAALLASLVIALVVFVFLTRSDETPTVGFVTPSFSTGIDDQVNQGIADAIRRLDIEAESLSPTSDPRSELESLIASDPDLIMFGAFQLDLGIDLFQIAEQFPDQNFLYLDGIDPGLPNTAVAVYASEEGAFLVGAAAALASDSGVIGFIGGTPLVIDPFRAGYEAGAAHVDPDITIVSHTLIGHPGSVFNDDDQVSEIARQLYADNVDVIFSAAGQGGLALHQVAVAESAARSSQLWAIGVDVDEWLVADAVERDHILTSMLKRHDTAITVMIEHGLGDPFEPGEVRLDLTNGGVGYSVSGNHLSTAVVERLETLRSEIIEGSIVVPSIPAGPTAGHRAVDGTVDVEFDGSVCSISPVAGIERGDIVRFDVSNEDSETIFFEVNGPDVDFSYTLGLVGPSTTQSFWVEADQYGSWTTRCELDFESRGEDTAFVVDPPESTVTAQARFDGESCTGNVPDTLTTGDIIAIEFHNDGPVSAGLGIVLLEQDVDLDELGAVRFEAWPRVDSSGGGVAFDVPAGQMYTVIADFPDPGPWLINCFTSTVDVPWRYIHVTN